MQRLRSLRKRSSPRDDLSVSGYHLRNESNTHLDTTTPTFQRNNFRLSSKLRISLFRLIIGRSLARYSCATHMHAVKERGVQRSVENRRGKVCTGGRVEKVEGRGGGNICPRTLTFPLDTRGNVPNPLANIQRYRYCTPKRQRERAGLFPPRTDVGRCFDETLPYPPRTKRIFISFVCGTPTTPTRTATSSVERSTTITARNRAVLARANCRSEGRALSI